MCGRNRNRRRRLVQPPAIAGLTTHPVMRLHLANAVTAPGCTHYD